MEDKRYIKKRYIFINFIMIGLAVLLIFLPKRYSSKELKPDLLFQEIIQNNRFISPDDIADKIIRGDRHFILVDVRTKEEYKAYHLKGAVNVPLANLFNKEGGDYAWDFDSENNQIIYYSNGDIYANQAWMLTRRLNKENIYVLKGGLNNWFETIIQPKKPKTAASDAEFALYNTRKAASMYFGKGGKSSNNKEVEVEEVMPVMKKTEAKEEEGGC